MQASFAIDHLTYLDCPPPEFVTLAASAGFGAVGLRIRPVDTQEQPWPMDVGSPMFAETQTQLTDTGLSVSQVESVFFDEHLEIASLERELEIGAELGAPLLLVVGMDENLDRFADRFAALDVLAASYGIRPILEPMSYRPVRTLGIALDIVERSEHGGIVTDSLHFFRAGDTIDRLAALDPRRLIMAQLCDAGSDPSMVPRDLIAGRGQNTDVPPLQWEARVGRRLPGDGVLPLIDFVRSIPETATIALEAPNTGLLAEIGPAEFFARAAESMRTLLAAAAQ